MTCTAHFLGDKPSIRRVAPGQWITTSAGRVYYELDGKSGVIDIPPHFPFDGASTPPAAKLAFAPARVALGMTGIDMIYAALPHDFDYRRQSGKTAADRIFGALLRTRAMEFSGFARTRRMWGAALSEWAVREFGAAAYAENGKRKTEATFRARELISELNMTPSPSNAYQKARADLTLLESVYGTDFWKKVEPGEENDA